MTGAVLRAVTLLLFLVAAAGPAQAQRVQSDDRSGDTAFAQRMISVMATDPAAAAAAAAAELARLARRSDVEARNEQASAHWIAAQASFRLGDNTTAESRLRAMTAVPLLAAPRQRARARASLLRGLMRRSAGEFGDALQLYREAQLGFIQVRDTRGQAQALQALGTLYNDIGDGEAATRYLELARETYYGDELFRLALYNNMGVAEQNLENLAAANSWYRRAHELAIGIGNVAYARHTQLNIAATALDQDQFAAAKAAVLQLGDTAQLADPAQRSNALRILAMAALHDGDRRGASTLIERGLAAAGDVGGTSAFRATHLAAYEIFSATGQPQRALEQLEIVRRIDEADAQLTASNRASLLAAQFRFDAQEARIDRLKAQQLERDIANQRNRTYIISASAVAIGLALSGLLWLAMRSRARARGDAAQLAVVNQQLEGALAAKTEFLASTSHEIRTPLNGILGMTQIMLADGALSGSMRSQVELVHDAGTAMRALVDDILDVAKLEHGGFVIAPRPTDLVDLIRRTTRLYETQAHDRGLTLTLDIDDTIGWQDVDPDRLTQIIFNLVGNAMKFTSAGGITVRLARSGGDADAGINLSVTDTGIGIAPEWHEAVFEMFRQVDGTRTRNFGGTGLGLAICRQLAEAMGGRMTLDSTEGVGSCFALHLPWQPVDPPAVIGRMSGQRAPAAPSVVTAAIAIVAEDPMRASILSSIVRQAGGEPVLARTAKDVDGLAERGALDWIVDARALALLNAPGAGNAVLRGRVLQVGIADAGSQSVQDTGRFDALVTQAQFSRNAVVAILAQWGVGTVGPHTEKTAATLCDRDARVGDTCRTAPVPGLVAGEI